jgi:hypothetical protein
MRTDGKSVRGTTAHYGRLLPLQPVLQTADRQPTDRSTDRSTGVDKVLHSWRAPHASTSTAIPGGRFNAVGWANTWGTKAPKGARAKHRFKNPRADETVLSMSAGLPLKEGDIVRVTRVGAATQLTTNHTQGRCSNSTYNQPHTG